MKNTVFIAHGSDDNSTQIAKEILASLSREGVSVWLDEVAIRPGDHLKDKIEDGLKRARHVLAVVTPESGKSRWVSKEVEIAARLKKRIIPVLASGASPKDIPARIRNRAAVVWKPEQAEKAKNEILRVVKERDLVSRLREYLVNE